MSDIANAPLDLYDIALLLNYERGTTDPRFRHTKLREVVINGDFQSIVCPPWDAVKNNIQDRFRTGLVFDRKKDAGETGATIKEVQGDESDDENNDDDDTRDLPSTMVPEADPTLSPLVHALSEKQRETLFWQARAHDACYQAVTLLQHFFDLYPPTTPLRVRTAAGDNYLTTVNNRVIIEFELRAPRVCTVSCVQPDGTMYLSGEGAILEHAISAYGAPEESGDGNVRAILDLSSMQFGELGRGNGGNSLFALESLDHFYDRVERIARGCDTAAAKTSGRIGPRDDDDWLREIAAKVKARWEDRAAEPWCGHCGAPARESKKCSACKEAHYCSKEHQVAAWSFHKRYCKGKKSTKS
jgi:hypothetical protein